MAKAQPLTPYGPQEAALLDAVDDLYAVRMDFFRAVARRTGKTASNEKSAFNRIVRDGHIGDQTAWRIKLYAELIKRRPEEFLRPSEARGATDDAHLRRRPPSRQELATQVADLTARVNELTDLVTDLAARGQSRNQAGKGGQ